MLTARVLDRSLLDGISPLTVGTTGPHDAEKVNVKMHMKAIMARAPAVLYEAVAPMVEKANMQKALTAAPAIRIGRRPKYRIVNRLDREPAIAQALLMTVIANASVYPMSTKKYVR